MEPFHVMKVCILEVDVNASFIFLFLVVQSSMLIVLKYSQSGKIEGGLLFDIFQRPQPPPRLLLEKQPPLGKL